MLYLFINPPTIMNFAPIIGIPQLIGILEENDIHAEMNDLNTDFITNALTKVFFAECKNSYEYIYSSYFIENIPVEFRKDIVKNKYTQIELEKQLEYYVKNIDFCNYILKNKRMFYNPILCHFATNIILRILELITDTEKQLIKSLLPGISYNFAPNKSKKCNINIEFIKYYINSDANIYKKFLKNKTEKIIEKVPTCVGISINTLEQLLPGLSLAYFIKNSNSDIHINIGGAFFSLLNKHINNIDEIINTFCDTISIGNNDNTVIELVKYINKKQIIENIPNILYCKNSKLSKTLEDKGMALSELPMPSFNGYKKSGYISPELILPVRASVSCYWGRCIFCDCNKNNGYQIKNVEKFVSELEYLSKKYSTKYFYIWDNAMHPDYLDRFADLLVKKHLNIKYSFYARFEKEFNKKLLEKLKKSGCLRINWGLDSASERILNFIDKGIELANVKRILEESHQLGIINFISLILGYPTEEKIDIEKDIEFLKENKRNIDQIGISHEMYFLDGAKVNEQKYEMYEKIITTTEERLKYCEEINQIFNVSSKYCWNYVSTYNILYADKYSYKLLRIINFIFEKNIKYKFIISSIISLHRLIYKIQLKTSKEQQN